jgi:hypothetical protein
MLLDDFFGEPQSETCADILVCGEEALKDLTQIFAIDSAAVIRDDYLRIAARGYFPWFRHPFARDTSLLSTISCP